VTRRQPEGTIECALCGKPLRRPGPHFVYVHGITAREYREQTGQESSPRRDTCPRGHSLADAPTLPNGFRECQDCKHEDERNLYAQEEAGERKRARGREYAQRPEVIARRKAYQATAEYKATNAQRQRERRARERARR
jgi:hypothetical protein